MRAIAEEFLRGRESVAFPRFEELEGAFYDMRIYWPTSSEAEGEEDH